MCEVTPQVHHVRGEEVHNRPLYRRGRRATAVKVFTIADESVHVLVFGVPSVNLTDEVKRITEPYGEVAVEKVEGYPNLEEFTDLYHLTFEKVTVARAAKRRLDGLEFFGGILHVCYAPELETIDETRAKLNMRRRHIETGVKNKRFRPGGQTRNCPEAGQSEADSAKQAGGEGVKTQEQTVQAWGTNQELPRSRAE